MPCYFKITFIEFLSYLRKAFQFHFTAVNEIDQDIDITKLTLALFVLVILEMIVLLIIARLSL